MADARAARCQAGVKHSTTHRHKLPMPAVLLLIGIITPVFFEVGPLRLSLYRTVLLLLFFPALIKLLSGKCGHIRVPDICVVLICLWSTISFFVVHGVSPMIETSGMLWIETFGAYLIGRCYIRTPEAFYAMSRLLFSMGVCITPFAVYELISEKNLILEFFGIFTDTYSIKDTDQRLGLNRVQGPFGHPIHFGVFFSALIGIVFFVVGYNQKIFLRLLRTAIIVGLGACSLSSGPLAAIMMQVQLIAWDGILRNVKSRWFILIGITAIAYVSIDILSNRTPFEIFISYFALNGSTAYGRLLIFVWGTKSIFDNPLFGIGMSADWVRPAALYYTSSVDMFWIVAGMRHGILAWALWFVLFFWIFASVALRRNLSNRIHAYRMGYLVTMAGLFAAGWTVHFWSSTYVLFVFLLSSGIWFLDLSSEPNKEETDQSSSSVKVPDLLYSRFSRDKTRSGKV